MHQDFFTLPSHKTASIYMSQKSFIILYVAIL